MGDNLQELVPTYDAFLRDERMDWTSRIEEAVDDGSMRVEIPLSKLRAQGLSEDLRNDPLRHLRALERAANDLAGEQRPGYDKEDATVRVSLSGPVGAQPSTPRQLTSSSLRQLVCVEGVATKVSTIKPKVVQSVHYCPATQQHSARHYVDETDPNLGLPALDATGNELPDKVVHITSAVYPTKDGDGHDLETEFGLSRFKDHQTILLQEMPEKAPMGQLPRSVNLVLDHDLVDRIKPGDRVRVVGVYRALSSAAQQSAFGVFKTVVLVNNIAVIGENTTGLVYQASDVKNIKTLATKDNILDILGRSVAPSIHGHEMIKRALVLQLLAGVEKNLENGTHLRGDINILMVGDPSTAKSQLLRSCMNIAPLAVSTTGKGSSGVGLTAAVTSDPDTRERRLEAGAMVLADRGIVCVDEFDKMGENDRVAIHEAMEQQTVTIAKAGIHASLNARCAVLAAANPVYGQYDRNRRIQENIGLPDSLLSRFDLLFVVLDQMDPTTDRSIAKHVLTGHCYRTNALDDEEDDNGEMNDPSVEKSIWLAGREGQADVLRHDFLRKYLHYCKSRTRPTLTESSREWIANRYAQMRAAQDDRTLPITARSLETVIRLATAHAKARLATHVEQVDCQAAMELLSFALYHEERVVHSPQRKRQRVVAPVSDDDDSTANPPSAAQFLAKLEQEDGIKESEVDAELLETLVKENRVQVSEGQVFALS